jgi:proline iminopeptidase
VTATTAAPSLPTGGYLPPREGHEVWWAEGGDATGCPVLIVHGGPGGASRPEPAGWFERLPVRWLVLDQRGCGRSTPAGRTEANRLGDLVDDMERLREALALERWAIAGGSWGARVALAYALRHPQRVAGLLLRSPFLGTLAETRRYIAPWSNWLGATGRDWVGAQAAEAVHSLYHSETESFIADSGLTLGDGLGATPVVQAWAAFDDAQSAPGGVAGSGARWSAPAGEPTAAQRASWAVHARYAVAGWGERDGVPRGLIVPPLAADAPVELVWGDADATCDPAQAEALAAALSAAGLAVRRHAVAGAGHRMGDARLAPALRAAARDWVARLQP